MTALVGGVQINIVKVKELFHLLPRLADELFSHVSGGASALKTFYLASMATLSDYISDVLVLVNNKKYVSVPIILRSFMDVYVDLMLVAKESKHLDSLVLQDRRNRRRWLEIKIDPRNNLLGSTTPERKEAYRNELKTIRKVISETQLSGVRVMSVSEKYSSLGLSEVYEKLYHLLSAHVHGDLGVLEKRHLTVQSGIPVQLKYRQDAPEENERETLPLFCMQFIEAVRVIAAELKIDALNTRLVNMSDYFMRSMDEPSEG